MNNKNSLVSVVVVSKDRKKDLIECIESYLNQSYKPLEIIVVDNASRPPLLTWLPKKYPKVMLVTMEANVGAAQGRNKGLAQAKGNYIVFTDDDAYADEHMVEKLVEVFRKKKDAGIVQPLIYDKRKKSMLQGAGHDINLLTGRIKAWGVREIDKGQYDGIREVPMCGCVWMVKRQVFEKIGQYDEDYFIPYEDSDFSLRTSKAGYKNFASSEAKTWHQGLKKTFVHPRVEWLGITSPERSYRVARNKIIFMRKHSPFPQNVFFFTVMLPGYAILHSAIIASTLRFDILVKYWLGLIAGIGYAVVYPWRGFKKAYQWLDMKLTPLKWWLMAWTDPLPWVVDKSAKTFLDLGCGQGKPMMLIKKRMKVKKTVGIDLFEPYIKEAKAKAVHDKYIIADVRKINFKSKSFDVVFASHVLEHLSRKEAWEVVKKMEKIAKKQVIIATPIGETYHPPVDGNPLQMHKSHFLPVDFEKKGYKTLKYGWRWLLGDEGIVHKTRNDLIRKLLYLFNILVTPIYYLFQPVCNYTFVAYKSVSVDQNRQNKEK